MTKATQSWREALAAYIRSEARPADKYGHQPRLYELTKLIGQGMDYDDDVVYAAVWLHDLGIFVGHRPEDFESLSRWDNLAYAMAQTPALLEEFGFPPGKVSAVLECIRQHQPSGEPVTTESTILRDADILEQVGAVGIMRTVCKVGRDTRFHTFTDALRALRKAHDELPAQVRLASTRSLLSGRLQVHADFLDAVAAEAGEELN